MVLYCMHLTRIEWDVREYKGNCNRSLDKEKEEKLEDTKGVIRRFQGGIQKIPRGYSEAVKRSTKQYNDQIKNNQKNINNDLEITTQETTESTNETKNTRECTQLLRTGRQFLLH